MTFEKDYSILTLSYSSEGSPALAVFQTSLTQSCLKITIRDGLKKITCILYSISPKIRPQSSFNDFIAVHVQSS
jgi:hypothetical protein